MFAQAASKIPHHVAVIMDGNGRWATQRGKQRPQGHLHGVQATRKLVRVVAEQAIPCLSLFAFSSENRQRPKTEVSALIKLFVEALDEYLDELAENHIELCFVGDLSFFPAALRAQIKQAEERTKGLQRMKLRVAVNYSGRWDIVQAVQQLLASQSLQQQAAQASQLEQIIAELLLIPEVDLLIRTGGEQRFSNFMLWQSAYSELFFTETLWPDFTEDEFLSILHCYGQRERRFGELKERT